jgi:hypothetical protein
VDAQEPGLHAVTVLQRLVFGDQVRIGIVLPADNLFGLPAGSRGLSVGHGWVVLLHPLTPGTHTIVITIGTKTITTTLVVVPGG